LLGVQAIFYHQFFKPDHPLHQSGMFYWYRTFIRKGIIIATKMKENS
jgi:hypothetical protein